MAEVAPVVEEVAKETYRVFVANLPSQLGDEDLVEAFKQNYPEGAILNGFIVRRFNRSLGYGFIEYGVVNEVSNAVDRMDGFEIQGRPLKCEVARPRGSRPQGGPRRGPMNRGPRRAPMNKRPVDNRPARVASEKSAFVSNIPFSFDEKALADVFQGLSVKESFVARRRPHYGEDFGFSKGFGFVEFESRDHRDKAISDFNNFECDGRTISVAIANERLPEAEPEAAPVGDVVQ